MDGGQQPRKSWFERITQWFQRGRQIVTAVGVALGMVVAASGLYKIALDDVVVIDKINVPKNVEGQGFTPEVVAQWLLDRLSRMRNQARIEQHNHTEISVPSQEPTMQVPGTDVQVATVIRLVREYLGRPEGHIHGEMFQDENLRNEKRFTLQLRVLCHNQSRDVVATGGTIGELMSDAATELLTTTDPLLSAAVFYRKDPVRAEVLVKRALGEQPDDAAAAAEAYNLWGSILLNRWRDKPEAPAFAILDEAIAKFTTAGKLDPRFARASANLGLAHREAAGFWIRRREITRAEARRARAEQAFRTAISIDRSLALAHYGLGLVLRDGCSKPWAHCCSGADAWDAERALAEATRLGPGQAERWFELGRMRAWSKPADLEGAMQAFTTALETNANAPQFCSTVFALRSALNDGCIDGAVATSMGSTPGEMFRTAVRSLRAKARVVGEVVTGKTRGQRRSSLQLVRQHDRLDSCSWNEPSSDAVRLQRAMALARSNDREAFCRQATPAQIEELGIACEASMAEDACMPALS